MASTGLYNGDKKILRATIQADGSAQFSCGFCLPKAEINYILGQTLQPGDTVTFTIEPGVVVHHVHEYKCACGRAIHS